jgi:hypothetical protein
MLRMLPSLWHRNAEDVTIPVAKYYDAEVVTIPEARDDE